MIRCAEVADVRDIVRVHVEAWRQAYSGLVPEDFLAQMLTCLGSEKRGEFWRQQIAHSQSLFFVATESKKVVGWIQAGASRDDDLPNASEIYAIYVLPSHWRRGVGQGLLTAVHRKFPVCSRKTLWVLHNNRSAIDFYRRFGYRADGAMKEMKVATGVVTEIRMRKEPNGQ